MSLRPGMVWWRLKDFLAELQGGSTHRRSVFRRIHDGNLWGDAESVSGPGSSLAATAAVRRELPALMARHGCRSLLDAPCGDCRWISELFPCFEHYHGVDIVPELVAAHQARWGNECVAFSCLDLASDPLPKADLILCRDCFIHLPTRQIRAVLANFKASGATFLLLTSDHGAAAYEDIPLGSFRPIDFEEPPFSFPHPLDEIAEGSAGRTLCLWRLTDVPER